ncbi:MAG: ATP-binding protein [Phormidesmis sp.]
MDSINASPTKNFFVDMLTRDIDLKDAILDLLDNCIDGIQRTIRGQAPSETPYEGFWAKIEVSETSFKIEDNCGGIPLDVAQRYAFRMGKPKEITDDDDILTIGTYGIGMKRAFFKLGRSAQVFSQTEAESFRVIIKPDWLLSDETWDLPLEIIDSPLDRNGTSLEVQALRDEAAKQLSTQTFQNMLAGEIEALYSYIIGKGFQITVNDKPVKPRPLVLQWEGLSKLKNTDKEAVAPYLYEAYEENVEVQLAVGFHRALPSYEEIENAEGKRRKRDTAGWTSVCNDRVVVANDKTLLTGWGEAGVPRYHPQYISISGIVHFKSTDARKLPITTTKRDIDASSGLYLHVKERMREGLKVFTTYTSKWKQMPKEEKQRSKKAKAATPAAMFDQVKTVDTSEPVSGGSKNIWKAVAPTARKLDVEQRYIPNLPSPPPIAHRKRISFNKPVEEVRLIAEHLFGDPDCPASTVGEACFEEILNQAQED